MKNDNSLTQAYLRSVLHYSPRSGVWTWRVDMGNKTAGRVAGFTRPDGYYYIMIKRKIFSAHRLAWLYMTGEWPPARIDHKRGIGFDNRWARIRLATHSQNLANTGPYKTNTSGYKGAFLHKPSGRWFSAISVQGKRHHLGYFDTAKLAHAAYAKAARKHFGEFARAR